MIEKLNMHSKDFSSVYSEKLAELFPECVTECANENESPSVKIDFEKLKQIVSSDIIDSPIERYQLNWPGKKNAARLACSQSFSTLRPYKEESIDFDNTGNLYLEGDNLDILKLLREDYLSRIKIIYIDPPYNTGSDLIYYDDFSQKENEYIEFSGQKDEEGNRIYQNSDSNGRFHTDWLNMIYPRLKVARDLLSDDGIIFISIGEEELYNLISVCKEIFGSNNYISTVSRVAKTASNMGTFFAASVDYIVCFAKNINMAKPFKGDVDESLYPKTELTGPRKGERFRDDVAFFQSGLKHGGSRYPIICPDGEIVNTPDNKPWRASEETFLKWKENGMIVFKETKTSPLIDEKTGGKAHWNLYTKSYLKDRQETGTQPRNILTEFINRKGADLIKTYGIPFDFAKPVDLIKYLIKIVNDKHCIILDFFSGSATTAHAIINQNIEDGGDRKFIMVQIGEPIDVKSEAYKLGFHTISEIGKERIRRVGKKILEEQEKIKSEGGLFSQNEFQSKVDVGFRVLKLDSSNMEDVYYRPEDSSESTIFEDNIKPDRTPEDLLFQIMLECNLPLSAKIETKKISGKEVFFVNNGYLIACFDSDIDEKVITEVAKMKPYYFILRDSSLSSDNVADNFDQIFQAYSKETIRRVL